MHVHIDFGCGVGGRIASGGKHLHEILLLVVEDTSSCYLVCYLKCYLVPAVMEEGEMT